MTLDARGGVQQTGHVEQGKVAMAARYCDTRNINLDIALKSGEKAEIRNRSLSVRDWGEGAVG